METVRSRQDDGGLQVRTNGAWNWELRQKKRLLRQRSSDLLDPSLSPQINAAQAQR